MPIRKFRSITEMEGNTWREPGDPRLFQAIRNTWDFAHRTIQPQFPPGVYKHASIEEAEKLRERWEEANFRAYRRRIGKPVAGGTPALPADEDRSDS